MSTKPYLFILIFFCLVGCSTWSDDSPLSGVENLASVAPKDALDSLGRIDYELLSDADRRYYDFLSVKVSDKSYVRHSSDSLILRVIDQESNHKRDGRYSEALYYGGRVYSDIGDYPTALKYFQEALELEQSNNNLELKKRILSQTGRLLNALRLYENAMPYIENAMAADSILGDSLNYMYDVQLLGAINFHAGNYGRAEQCFTNAWCYASKISPRDTIQIKMYLAAIQYDMQHIDSALTLIKDIPERIHPLSRNMARAYAAKIYLASANLDKAYQYAKQIVSDDNPDNRKVGYQLLMSSPLQNFIPIDSLGHYIEDYSHILEAYFDANQRESAIFQNAFYNYHIHERERERAERHKAQWQLVVFITVTILLILIIIILVLKYRQKSYIVRLREAIDNVAQLQRIIDANCNMYTGGKSTITSSDMAVIKQDVSELRMRLRQELIDMHQANKPQIPLKILQSPAYAELESYIKQERIIADKNPLWGEIETTVLDVSPNFKERLMLLTGAPLKESTYRLALLLKCGVTPTQLTTLVGKTKGTISYQRGQLCMKVLGENMGTKVIDDIIRLL